MLCLTTVGGKNVFDLRSKWKENMYGNSASESINASVQSPSQPWIELNIDGVTQGAVAIDFTSGHPELVFKVSDEDLNSVIN
jgi:hypothetical protein